MARARSYVATELLGIRRAKIASEGPRPYSGLESKVTEAASPPCERSCEQTLSTSAEIAGISGPWRTAW